MKVDFGKVVFKGVDGKPKKVDKPEKFAADLLYNFSTDVEIARLAMEIDKSGTVDLNKDQLRKMKGIIEGSPTIFAWVKMGITDFLEGQIKKVKDSKEEK